MRSLYHSITPNSLPQHLAFYDLFPDTELGQKALTKGLQTLEENPELHSKGMALTNDSWIHQLIGLVNGADPASTAPLDEEQLAAIEKLAQGLHHHKLKGHGATSEDEVLALPPEEIDVSRALLLTQLDPDQTRLLRTYEAMLDLMALQINIQLPKNPSHLDKIDAINHFLFFEQGFRFPPQSKHMEEIDTYTFLAPVLDSKKGVCLGISTLVYCLAQRLDLPLEIITPPGHIYLRYRHLDEEVNIETTARGIDVPSEHYLGINNRKLSVRNAKEMIGMTHFNQAAVLWREQKYEEALTAYKKAGVYLPGDKLVQEFRGYIALFCGQEEEGKSCLSSVADWIPDEAVTGSCMAKDYLSGRADVEAIRAVFLPHEENRQALTEKRDALKEVVARCPNFHAGHFHLGALYLELGRTREALTCFERCHKLQPDDVIVEFILTQLYLHRFEGTAAQKHLMATEKLLSDRNHHPRAFDQLRRALRQRFPAL